jgi:hypothetical protein
MLVFLKEAAFAISALTAFGIAGSLWLTAFRDRYLFLAAPLVGILMASTATIGLYAILWLPFASAAFIACATALLLSVIFVARITAILRPRLWPSLVATVIAGLAVALSQSAAIALGGPAITYMDGTDHAGYAHLADWLLSHSMIQPPTVSPDRCYESWPALLFQIDPRFACFAYLAILSKASGLSGLFVYDSATAITWAAGVLAVAGVFARRPATLLLLAAGLFTSHWFEYGRTGFLGKTLGYPASLMLLGLFLRSTDGPWQRLSLLLLTTATASVHSGLATALVLMSVGGLYIAMEFDLRQAALLISMSVAAVITTGVIARPVLINFPRQIHGWDFILPRVLDLDSQFISLVGPGLLAPLTVAAVIFWGLFLATAICLHDRIAIALLGSPCIILLVFAAGHARASATQFIGLAYPMMLCGAIALLDNPDLVRRRLVAVTTIALLGMTIGLRQARFAAAVERYTLASPLRARFSKEQLDALSAAIGRGAVEIDIAAPQPALVALVELGRAHDLQYSAAAWKTLFGYRQNWNRPLYAPADLRLTYDASGYRLSDPRAEAH